MLSPVIGEYEQWWIAGCHASGLNHGLIQIDISSRHPLFIEVLRDAVAAGGPPTSVATIGRLAAIASNTVKGIPSLMLVSKNASAPASKRPTSCRSPRKTT